ncbi:MAG: DUF2459 domain-containing protein [Synechococcales cyanobacterium C42_A2020_086]|jgi:uncharacterized protein (TIGR02117 family)|nr:DUF2459 domain-containing protein [Synechococcales cyanobacterium C42_A2020_086]
MMLRAIWKRLFSRRLAYWVSAAGFIPISLVAALLIPRQWQSPFSDTSQSQSQNQCNLKICVARYDIHTNIIVPVYNDQFDWRTFFANQDGMDGLSSNYRYLGFGRGERDWYLNPPQATGDALYRGLQALLQSNEAILRVQKHVELPQASELKCMGVNAEQYQALMAFLQASFQRNAVDQLMLVMRRPEEQANFYMAQGHYNLLNNSNSWTADGLRAAGLNTPLWAGISEAVLLHLRDTC